MEWANFVAEKNEGILFPVEIRVVASYSDRLFQISMRQKYWRFRLTFEIVKVR